MNIEVATTNQLKPIKLLYSKVTNHLRKNGVDQWNRFYPNRWIIGKDIKQGHLHAIFNEETCIGVVVINNDQSSKYDILPWNDPKGGPAVIHRLAVQPESQGKGVGKLLLQHAEEWAKSKGFTSIRLDAYTANPNAIKMYERAGYSTVGQIQFPFRKHPFQCFEKIFIDE
jgi:ribosomal protein S18 acetylase RimI-like enzyme